MPPFSPYRPVFEKYWSTVFYRFQWATVHRHREAIQRGLLNRMRASGGAS